MDETNCRMDCRMIVAWMSHRRRMHSPRTEARLRNALQTELCRTAARLLPEMLPIAL